MCAYRSAIKSYGVAHLDVSMALLEWIPYVVVGKQRILVRKRWFPFEFTEKLKAFITCFSNIF